MGCTLEGSSCDPYFFDPYYIEGCCEDYVCANVDGSGSDEGTCIRKCGVALARCDTDRDCCDGGVCTKSEGDVGKCVFTPTCDKAGERCSWDEECCSGRCALGQNGWDPKTCAADTCIPRGDPCTVIDNGGKRCCKNLTCNDKGENKSDPRCY